MTITTTAKTWVQSIKAPAHVVESQQCNDRLPTLVSLEEAQGMINELDSQNFSKIKRFIMSEPKPTPRDLYFFLMGLFESLPNYVNMTSKQAECVIAHFQSVIGEYFREGTCRCGSQNTCYSDVLVPFRWRNSSRKKLSRSWADCLKQKPSDYNYENEMMDLFDKVPGRKVPDWVVTIWWLGWHQATWWFAMGSSSGVEWWYWRIEVEIYKRMPPGPTFGFDEGGN